MGFPGGTSGKEPAYQSRRYKKFGFNPWNLVQYSYLGNLMDRKPWWATVYGVTESQTGQSNLARQRNRRKRN